MEDCMQIFDADAHPPYCDMEVDFIGNLTPALFFKRLRKAGIGRAAGTLLLPKSLQDAIPSENDIRRINDCTLALANAYQGEYVPGIHIHPALKTESCAEIERCANRGVRLIGEIQSAWLADLEYHEALSEIFACAEQFQMFVSIHPDNPEQLRPWAGKFAKLNFLYGSCQHNGIAPVMSVSLLREYPNLYLRLSQVIFLANYYLHTFADKFPVRQVLFGSGYPLCNPAARTAGCLWELRDQAEDTKRMIFFENAAACFTAVQKE